MPVPARQFFYAESTAESTTTSTSFIPKTTVTFTPDANATYFLIATWFNQAASTTRNVESKLVEAAGAGSATYNAPIFRPNNASDYVSQGSIGIFTAGASPVSETMQIQYRHSDG